MGVPNGSSSNGHVSSRAAKHNIPSHFIGGNHLDAAPPSSVKDFVANHEGHSVISSVSGSPTSIEKSGPALQFEQIADSVGLVE
jgi:hypothetical protein